MNFGQGAYGFVNNQTGGGGGGTVIGARNGTSDVANFVELGLNNLIHDTTFDNVNFEFEITQQGGFPGLLLSSLFQTALLEGTDGVGNEVRLSLNGGAKSAQVEFNSSLFLDLDFANDRYLLGDISGVANNTFLQIDDLAQTVDFLQGATNKKYFDIDFGLNTLNIGDKSNAVNGYEVAMDIANRDFAINDTAGLYVDFFTGAGQYKIGDLSNLVSGMKMVINVTSDDFSVRGSVTDQRLLALSVSTGDYSIGDLDNIANGSRMEIHDVTERFDFVTNVGGVIGTFRNDGLQTTDPTGGLTSHKAWQFGDKVAAVSVLDTTKYLEVNANGTIYKLATFN